MYIIYHLIVGGGECIYNLNYFSILLFRIKYCMSLLCDNFGNKFAMNEWIIRPALTYGSECWAMKVNNKRKIAIPRRWGWFAGSSECWDGITCETTKFDAYYTFSRSTSGRLRWFGQVQKRDPKKRWDLDRKEWRRRTRPTPIGDWGKGLQGETGEQKFDSLTIGQKPAPCASALNHAGSWE